MRRPTVAATKLSSRSSVCRVRGLMPAVAAPSFAFRECRLACGFNVIKHSRVILCDDNQVAAGAKVESECCVGHVAVSYLVDGKEETPEAGCPGVGRSSRPASG